MNLKLIHVPFFHFAWNFKLFILKLFSNLNKIEGTIVFDEKCKYLTPNPDNQGDINKLLGLRKTLFSAKNATMLGWRWNPEDNLIDIFLYNHNGNCPQESEITINSYTKCTKVYSVEIGKEINFSMTDYDTSVYVTVDDIYKIFVTKEDSGYYKKLIIGYFGGQSKPQRLFTILVNNFKYVLFKNK